MKFKQITFIILCLINVKFQAQNTGVIRGNVKDKNIQESIIGAVIVIDGTSIAATTDADGNYKINAPIGTYNIKTSYIGFETQIKYNISVTTGNAQVVNFEIDPISNSLNEVAVVYEKGKSAVATDMITPLSVQQLTTEEIKSNPGGNFDVSKVIQTLPGVGGSSGGASRNDIIIRGGAPNENVYYVDGIEIPVLNHFQTQGSSGGAQGILNVSFIEDVKLSSSAFDAKYDNAVASTFIIKQRQGNPEKISGNARVSFTESALTVEGPLGKKTNYLMSVRRSYLDFLFTAIDLPIRPNFTDAQYKITTQLNDKTTLTALGVGAIDEFSFAKTKNSSLENEYFRRSLPFINQWNYTTGFTLKRLINKGYVNIALSRNMFNNELDRFEDAKNGDETKRNLKIRSQEMENKLRIDVNKYIKGWKFSYGIMAQFVKYNTDLYNKLSSVITNSLGNEIILPVEIKFKSAIEFFKYGAFTQVAKNIFKEKLLVSFGLRSDMNSFLSDGNNPINSLSPRLSFAYHLNKKVDLTASIGRYHKIPTYTTMGYKNETSEYINKSMKYIQSNHLVLGSQYLPNEALRFTLEGFYKQYSNYPISISNGSSLANQGGDFGSIGSEAITSIGEGKTYGFEFFVQQKLLKRLFYVVSYTFVRSLYSGLDGQLIASSWDNQHLLSSTLGYKFKKEWSLGLKYRFAGGNPYTPFDLISSQQNYALIGSGVLNYNKINSERLNAFNQLDFRLDKKINYKKTTLDIYIDIQNLLLFEQDSAPYYTFKRKADNSGFETKDGKLLNINGSNAIPVILENKSKNSTPTIGIIFEF